MQLKIDHAAPKIPATELSSLFEPFYRVGPFGGGLGLAIARSICRTHGGDVSITQGPDSCICLTVDLPAVPVSSPTPS